MNLKEWSRKNLSSIPSMSTNPTHKKILARRKLQELSPELTTDQYNRCVDFIDWNFDESKLDESTIEEA